MQFMSCGAPDYAIDFDQLEVKFRRNSEFAISKERQDEIIRTVKEL